MITESILLFITFPIIKLFFKEDYYLGYVSNLMFLDTICPDYPSLRPHHQNFSVYVEPFKASSRYIDYMTMGDSIYNAEGGFSLTMSY
jgi:hypothetical protein